MLYYANCVNELNEAKFQIISFDLISYIKSSAFFLKYSLGMIS